ncbi:nuclear transport factor 2 family protein [Nocardia sp. NBC_01499]|uniref:nuclear transport factor 2 family protein n=1 Tax=Nocardia sp. NBC_01499 TaxID=2903597 RepID=UPI00386BA0FF
MSAVGDGTYIAVQRLYAALAAALDEERFEEAAALFTDDAELVYAAGRPPVRTRKAILDDLVEHNRTRPDRQARRRHWFGQIRLAHADDGGFTSDAYALIVSTNPGESPAIMVSGAVHDVIVEKGDSYLFSSRSVRRDGAQ